MRRHRKFECGLPSAFVVPQPVLVAALQSVGLSLESALRLGNRRLNEAKGLPTRRICRKRPPLETEAPSSFSDLDGEDSDHDGDTDAAWV